MATTGFQLQYGSFLHPVSEAAVARDLRMLETEGGFPYGIEETWRIRGLLQAPDPASLIALAQAMQAAYSQDYQTIQLIAPSQVVSIQMPGVSAIGGVRVIQPPSFPNDGSDSAELSTFWTYTIVVQGTYPTPGANANTLISWYETLLFRGGGPDYVFLQPLTGLPQKQQVAESTPYQVTQRGNAVGLLNWPVPPSPIWPDAYLPKRSSSEQKDPKRKAQGSGALVYVEWPVEWNYEFESAGPLQGTPTLFPQ